MDRADKGVLRPFFREVANPEVYHFTREWLLANPVFWLRAAALDYICGIVDRNAHDVLLVEGNPVLIDNGFSFVQGVDFIYQHSLVRETLVGERLPESVLADLECLDFASVRSQVDGLLEKSGVVWMQERTSVVLEAGVVV